MAGKPGATVSVRGTPELTAALERLADQLVGPKGEEALMAAGRVVADEWAARVPVGAANDPHPGAYRRAMQQPDAVRVSHGTEARKPAISVAPAEVPDLPYEQQPHAYAGVLEYGDGNQGPQPSARSAWEAAQGRAAQALSDSLGKVAKAAR
jgi:hypothetical protein